jgi:hypothetical protein
VRATLPSAAPSAPAAGARSRASSRSPSRGRAELQGRGHRAARRWPIETLNSPQAPNPGGVANSLGPGCPELGAVTLGTKLRRGALEWWEGGEVRRGLRRRSARFPARWLPGDDRRGRAPRAGPDAIAVNKGWRAAGAGVTVR